MIPPIDELIEKLNGPMVLRKADYNVSIRCAEEERQAAAAALTSLQEMNRKLEEALKQAIHLIEDAEKDTNWSSAPWHEDSATVKLQEVLDENSPARALLSGGAE
jgi:hypothetical protein